MNMIVRFLCAISPTNTQPRKNAARSGRIVGVGMLIPSCFADGCAFGALSLVSAGAGAVPVDWPAIFTSIFCSSRVPCGTSEVICGDFRSQSGYRDVTCGMVAKL